MMQKIMHAMHTYRGDPFVRDVQSLQGCNILVGKIPGSEIHSCFFSSGSNQMKSLILHPHDPNSNLNDPKNSLTFYKVAAAKFAGAVNLKFLNSVYVFWWVAHVESLPPKNVANSILVTCTLLLNHPRQRTLLHVLVSPFTVSEIHPLGTPGVFMAITMVTSFHSPAFSSSPPSTLQNTSSPLDPVSLATLL